MCLARGLSAQGICFLSQLWREFKGRGDPNLPLHQQCALGKNWDCLALQSSNHIAMSIIFCLPYWDSFAFYLIISTTEPALTLSFQNHLQILFFRPILRITGSVGPYRSFCWRLSDTPIRCSQVSYQSLLVLNVYLPAPSIC